MDAVVAAHAGTERPRPTSCARAAQLYLTGRPGLAEFSELVMALSRFDAAAARALQSALTSAMDNNPRRHGQGRDSRPR